MRPASYYETVVAAREWIVAYGPFPNAARMGASGTGPTIDAHGPEALELGGADGRRRRWPRSGGGGRHGSPNGAVDGAPKGQRRVGPVAQTG
jgi:hypothetical protein